MHLYSIHSHAWLFHSYSYSILILLLMSLFLSFFSFFVLFVLDALPLMRWGDGGIRVRCLFEFSSQFHFFFGFLGLLPADHSHSFRRRVEIETWKNSSLRSEFGIPQAFPPSRFPPHLTD